MEQTDLLLRPYAKSTQNKTAVILFKGFFEFFYKYRKTCDILLQTKRLVVDYDVLWEEVFPSQDDCCSCMTVVVVACLCLCI